MDDGQHLIFEILLKCGLRNQEAVYLTWENIDFGSGTAGHPGPTLRLVGAGNETG
jgi:integrase